METMALIKRNQVGESQRLGDRATGDWYVRKGTRTRIQRYEEAPPYDGTVHWYRTDEGPWRAYRTSDVKKHRPPKRIRQRKKH